AARGPRDAARRRRPGRGAAAHRAHGGGIAMSDTVLELAGIAKHYGGVHVLRDVSLRVPAGSVTALIGPNGAGKSTLANVASGMVRPDAGRVMLAGRDVTRTATWRRASLGLGRTFQNLELFEGLTVLENVMVGAHAHGLGQRELRAASMAA